MNRRLLLSASSLALLAAAPSASAQCPLCALAAGAGIGIAKKFGIDDLVTGAWVGAFTVALVAWTISWLEKRKIRFRGRDLLTVLAWYAMMILPLQWMGFIGHPLNTIFGYDRLLVGMVFGSIVFYGAHNRYVALKKRNGGHAWFPLQKVVWPVGSLLLLSIALFFIAKRFPPF